MKRTPEEEAERLRIRRERDLVRYPEMEREVPRLLGLRYDKIAASLESHGITERITREQAARWAQGEDPIPDWLQNLRDRQKARRVKRQRNRASQRRREIARKAAYEQAFEAAYETVPDAMLAGKTRFSGAEEGVAQDLGFRALKEFMRSNFDKTSLDALDRAALKYIGYDINTPIN